MVLTLKQAAVVTLTVATVCFLGGRFSNPSKVEIKEVTKVVYKEAKHVKKDVVKTTKKKVTIAKDGTITKETETTKRDASTIDTSKELDKETTKSKVVTNRPNWHLNLNYIPISIHSPNINGAISIQYRIFSEFYLGGFVNTNQQYGISIGIGF